MRWGRASPACQDHPWDLRGDDDAVAFLHLTAKDALAGIFLRVEDHGRTFEMPQTLVNTGCFYHTTVLCDISEKHGQSAILGVDMCDITDTAIGTVCVE